ncbi:MAG: hypothetical protein GX968_00295 [Tissierellia bacterium]|nr:hypothetical protein [Tissierellia bacterium]
MNDLDKYLKEELNRKYSSPEYINRELILNFREEFRFINLMFFIASLFQSLFVILIGVIFVSDIFLKIFTIGFGLFFLNLTISIYILTISGKGVAI